MTETESPERGMERLVTYLAVVGLALWAVSTAGGAALTGAGLAGAWAVLVAVAVRRHGRQARWLLVTAPLALAPLFPFAFMGFCRIAGCVF
ncbi:MAG: hypothetical protein WDN24_00650 [Sphingomonas sp.]